MKIHLKYIYVGILAILVLWSGFNIYNGYHKLNVEKAAIANTLVSQSIKACYKAYDDVHATQEEKDKLKIYEENISKAPNSRVKAGIAMSMIDYSIMHITSATLETITGDDDQFVDPAHNFALQDLTDIQTQLLASQSTDTDEDSVNSSEQASFAEETTK